MNQEWVGRSGAAAVAAAALGVVLSIGAPPPDLADRVRWPQPAPAGSSLSSYEFDGDRLPALTREPAAPRAAKGPGFAPLRSPAGPLPPAGRIGEPPPIPIEGLNAGSEAALRDAPAPIAAARQGSAASARSGFGAATTAFFAMPALAARTARIPQAAKAAAGKRRLERMSSVGVLRAVPTQINRLSRLNTRAPKFSSAAAGTSQHGAPAPAATTAGTPGPTTAAAGLLGSSGAASNDLKSASGSTHAGGIGSHAAIAAAGEPAITPARAEFDMNDPRTIRYEITGLAAEKTTVCYEVLDHRRGEWTSPSGYCASIGTNYIMPFKRRNGGADWGNHHWEYKDGKWIGTIPYEAGMWGDNKIKAHFILADATTGKKVDGYLDVVKRNCNALTCGPAGKLHHDYVAPFSPMPPPCRSNQSIGGSCSEGTVCMLGSNVPLCSAD
ncbi:MAG: hypothetical protein HY553_11490 [Elusimicrobia bacterium]|nr:hypothetical protein [Elusimicrobiota bacterium]